MARNESDAGEDGKCGRESCDDTGDEDSDDSAATGPSGPLLHGDTSVPDDQLVKFYGDNIPDERFLMARCKKMPPVKFNHCKHVDMKIARCGNCHHKEPKQIKSCAECHVYAPEKKKDIKYQSAHHNLCQRCHKAHKKGREGPPLKCKDCHRAENTAAANSQCPLPKEDGK